MNPFVTSLSPNYFGIFHKEGYFGLVKLSDYILLLTLSTVNPPKQPKIPPIPPQNNNHKLVGCSCIDLKYSYAPK